MTPMILTEEQERLIAQVAEPVEVRNTRGRVRGVFSPVSSADAEALAQVRKARAAGGPRIPSAQVQAHLRRLNEIRQTEPMDEAWMLELLRRMQAGEEIGPLGKRGWFTPPTRKATRLTPYSRADSAEPRLFPSRCSD